MVTSSPWSAPTQRRALLAILAGAAFLGVACEAASPLKNTLDSTVPPDRGPLDIPPGCPATPQLAAPKLDPFPDPSPNALQAFRGRAAGATMVTARGGAGTAAPQSVGDGGEFCLEVRLIEDAQNTVTFIPLDERGCPGESTVVTLRHQSIAGADGGVSAITNVAQNGAVTSSQPPEDDAELSRVNDGDPATSVRLKFWDIDITDNGSCDAFAWIQIDLGKPYTVSKIKLHWSVTKGAPYAVCYAVLLSKVEAPGAPDASSADWTVAVQKPDGTPEVQELAIDPEVARHVAVLLFENDSMGLQEEFEIGEIEVLGQDPNAVPPPPPDRCE